MRRVPLIVALALAVPALSGCGLHPLYAGGGSGPVARGLADVAVAPIAGKSGWLMRAALQDQLSGAKPDGTARYRLDVRLEDQLEGLGLLSNNTIARERRTLNARYQLVDTANNAIVLDESAMSDAGVDVVTSEYATVAAEQSALENLTRVVAAQIVLRVATELRARNDEPVRRHTLPPGGN